MKIIGHRGAAGLAPENTTTSLRKALEHQANEAEFDLRVTKDRVVVLHHGRKLQDPDGKKYLIKRSSYLELKKHKPDLASLEELLEYREELSLYLEVKHWERVEPIVKIIKKYPVKGLSIGSKSQKTLLELHRALPEVPKIVIHPWSGLIATRRARQVGTKRISMNKLWLWSGFIRVMSKRGWQLSAYTVNNPQQAQRWQRQGLAGVVTDYPDRFEKE